MTHQQNTTLLAKDTGFRVKANVVQKVKCPLGREMNFKSPSVSIHEITKVTFYLPYFGAMVKYGM